MAKYRAADYKVALCLKDRVDLDSLMVTGSFVDLERDIGEGPTFSRRAVSRSFISLLHHATTANCRKHMHNASYAVLYIVDRDYATRQLHRSPPCTEERRRMIFGVAP